MTRHKHTDVVCIVIVLCMIVTTCVFISGESFGLVAAHNVPPYASKLFSTDKVHTVDIVVDQSDWNNMIANAQNEEYIPASVVINGEKIAYVGIRPKGNSSLSTIARSDSDRYSFKIEFDHYVSGRSYYGLDKLALNNIAQDNTYLKDYVVYQMMNYAGADAPLSSFAYITVNGEEWGLYLAVEAVENAFAERSYGSDYGQLYKPDSMNMNARGGENNEERQMFERFEVPEGVEMPENFQIPEDFQMPEGFEIPENFRMPDGTAMSDSERQPSQNNMPPNDLNTNADTQNFDSRMPNREREMMLADEGTQQGERIPPINDEIPDFENFGEGVKDETRDVNTNAGGGENGDGNANADNNENGDVNINAGRGGSGNVNGGFAARNMGENAGNFAARGGGGGFGGTNDVALIYSDDNVESYKNIFDNAKFKPSDEDKNRLIDALKKMNEGDVENSVNIDEVIRYFVVHNFVLNSDSYTGSILHNYYLHEKDGILSMIAWDYNLAFGGMGGMGNTMGSGATSMVNYPVDSPMLSGTLESRPMISWIFNNEQYLEMYHEIFDEFIDSFFKSGEFEKMIDNTIALISPYVEKDPSAFCTYEDFLTAASTLKEFCLRRAESISGQLVGIIPSTSEGQAADSSNLIDASDIDMNKMGSNMTGFGRARNNNNN